MATYYCIHVKNKLSFLEEILNHYCNNASLSLEGDLSQVKLESLIDFSTDETKPLKRQTASPIQDFVVLPLNQDTKPILLKSVFPRIGFKKNAEHIQIEKENKLVFGAYDCFHPECVWLYGADQDFIHSLKEQGLVLNY